MAEANPYDPPRADLGTRRRPARTRPMLGVARVFVGLWGLFILAGPSRTGPRAALARGQVVAKVLGAVLFVVAVFPVGHPGPGRPGVEPSPEDL